MYNRLSVRMERLGSHWTDLHEMLYFSIFRKSVEKIQGLLKSDKNISTLHEDQYTFLIISLSFLLRIRNVSDKSSRQNLNTYFVFDKDFSENLAFYEMVWKNTLQPDKPHIKIRSNGITCWKATNTPSKYVMLIAISLLHWIHERASMLRYMYITCLVLKLQEFMP